MHRYIVIYTVIVDFVANEHDLCELLKHKTTEMQIILRKPHRI